MRILITGGMGFVGGRLAQYLVQNSLHEISIATRNPVGPAEWLPAAQVRRVDWNSVSKLTDLCHGFDVVAHLAGVNTVDATNDPVLAYEFNIVATERLVQAAVRAGVRRMIYLSTAHVYGSPLQGDVNEYTCPFPVHPYSISHRAAEDIVRMAHATNKLEGVIVRLSNAYGAPTHEAVKCWMLLVNDLCRQAVIDGRLVLNSSGQQYRNFIPMQFACAALAYLLEVPAVKLGDSLFNLGGNQSSRVLDIASRIADIAENMLGKKLELLRRTAEPGPASTPLLFSTERLHESGFSIDGNTYEEKEIRGLLKYCQENKIKLGKVSM